MEFLSREAFDLWRQGHDHKIEQILNAVTHQTNMNLSVENRLATVEALQENCTQEASKRASWTSAIVAAIISVVGSIVIAVLWG